MMTALVALVFSTGCYGSHLADAGTRETPDAAMDAAPPVVPLPLPSEDLRCGPNLCLVGEVCCDALCGACTLPEECVDYECAVGGGRP